MDGAAVLTTGVRLMAPNVGPSVPPDCGAKIDPGLSDGGAEDVAADAAGGSWDTGGVGVGTVVTSGVGAETGSAGGLVTGVTSAGGVTVARGGGGVTSRVRVEGTEDVDVTAVSTLAGWEKAAPSGVDVVSS